MVNLNKNLQHYIDAEFRGICIFRIRFGLLSLYISFCCILRFEIQFTINDPFSKGDIEWEETKSDAKNENLPKIWIDIVMQIFLQLHQIVTLELSEIQCNTSRDTKQG